MDESEFPTSEPKQANPPQKLPTTSKASPLATILDFIKHPGLNMGLGLIMSGLAQFTATVPVKDRSTPTLLGFGYALAIFVVDQLKQYKTT